MNQQTYFPGTRVIVFDSRLFKCDKCTPLSRTMQPATVLCWYGFKSKVVFNYDENGNEVPSIYESCVDVRFDHDGRVSTGHFTFHGTEMEIIQ